MRKFSIGIVCVVLVQLVFCSCSSDEQNTAFTQDFTPIKIDETEDLGIEEIIPTTDYSSEICLSITGDNKIVGESDDVIYDADIIDHNCTTASAYRVTINAGDYSTGSVFDFEDYHQVFGNFRLSGNDENTRQYAMNVRESLKCVEISPDLFNDRFNFESIDAHFGMDAISYSFTESDNPDRFGWLVEEMDCTVPIEFDLITVRQSLDGIPLFSPYTNSSSYSNVKYTLSDLSTVGWMWDEGNTINYLMEDNNIYEIRFMRGGIDELLVQDKEIIPISTCIENSYQGVRLLLNQENADSANIYAVELIYAILTEGDITYFNSSANCYLIPVWAVYLQVDSFGDDNCIIYKTVYLDAFTGKLLYTNI